MTSQYYCPDGDCAFGSGYGTVVDNMIGFLMWSIYQVICYNYPRLDSLKGDKKSYNDFKNRMVCFTHGSGATIMNLYLAYKHYDEWCGM